MSTMSCCHMRPPDITSQFNLIHREYKKLSKISILLYLIACYFVKIPFLIGFQDLPLDQWLRQSILCLWSMQ